MVKVSTNGILTVIAGNGHAGLSGDGGPATDASLNGPVSVAVDAAGNVYVSDAERQDSKGIAGSHHHGCGRGHCRTLGEVCRRLQRAGKVTATGKRVWSRQS